MIVKKNSFIRRILNAEKFTNAFTWNWSLETNSLRSYHNVERRMLLETLSHCNHLHFIGYWAPGNDMNIWFSGDLCHGNTYQIKRNKLIWHWLNDRLSIYISQTLIFRTPYRDIHSVNRIFSVGYKLSPTRNKSLSFKFRNKMPFELVILLRGTHSNIRSFHKQFIKYIDSLPVQAFFYERLFNQIDFDWWLFNFCFRSLLLLFLIPCTLKTPLELALEFANFQKRYFQPQKKIPKKNLQQKSPKNDQIQRKKAKNALTNSKERKTLENKTKLFNVRWWKISLTTVTSD